MCGCGIEPIGPKIFDMVSIERKTTIAKGFFSEKRSAKIDNSERTLTPVSLVRRRGKERKGKEKNGEKVAFVGVASTPSAIRADVLSQLD